MYSGLQNYYWELSATDESKKYFIFSVLFDNIYFTHFSKNIFVAFFILVTTISYKLCRKYDVIVLLSFGKYKK